MARKEKLELNVYSDEHHSIFGEFIVEGDTFKLTNSSSIDPSLLINLGLNKEGALLAYKKLLKGSSTSKQCKGFREKCIITPQNIDFVYIDDKKKLTLFVSPEFMSPLLNSEKSFITPEIDEKALIINNSIIYSGVSNEDSSYQDNYSYYNESYLGLGNDNYLRSDFNLGTSNGLSFDDLSYNHISGQNKYKIGYQSSNQYWNATDTLESFNNFSSYIFSTGSTNDLRVLKEEDYERFYFSSPRSGRLEVKNDQGRILISKNINNGPQYISYYDLPKGTYNVSIKVFDGDNVIFEENKLIINKNNFSAKVGELDYKISLGYLSDEFVNTSLDNNNEYEDYQAPFFLMED
ncbi:TcfC E-set like domain-containing protein [Vibrio parahaemolyticus]|nr:TcfC E-set like domain-containing protein [Vibrio parahaemolyticus]